MSTRCRIYLKNEDYTFTRMYCHFDGYLSGVGLILLENYQNPRKVKSLFDFGYGISQLESDFDDLEFYENIPNSIVNDWKSTSISIEYDYMFDGEFWWVQNDKISIIKLSHTLIDLAEKFGISHVDDATIKRELLRDKVNNFKAERLRGLE